MKKKILSLALTFAMLSAVPMSVSAETLSGGDDWGVSFSGSGMESNFTSSDMDKVIYGMQPGDTAAFQVTLTNEHSKEADWYMSNEVVRSMEDSMEVSGGAYEYLLTYTDADGEVTTIFSSDSIVDDNTSDEERGLEKISEAFGEWFYLSRLAGGASGTVNLEVKLDGETIGNDYQNKLAELAMQFAAEEAAEDEIVTNRVPGKDITIHKEVTVGKDAETVKIAKTGDDVNVMLYVSVTALAAGMVILILVLRRVHGGQEEQAAGAGRTARRRGRRRDR